MIKGLLKGILSGVAGTLLANYRNLSIQLCRIEAAKSYLQGVRMARQSAIGLMWMGLVIGLICVGLLLFHVGLFVLLPWTVKAKAVLGMVLGLVYVGAGAFALHSALDEAAWMRKSGATRMLEDAIRPSAKS